MRMFWISVATFVLLLNTLVHGETVCEEIYSHKKTIRGVVTGDNKTGYLFADNIVYEFNPSEDFTSPKEKNASHSLYLRKPGIPVEKMFIGVYLKGKSIHNVYAMIDPNGTLPVKTLFFVLTGGSDETDPKNSGFSYDMHSGAAQEMDNTYVPKDFPLIYFGDSHSYGLVYQISEYTFGLDISEEAELNEVTYFSFNIMEPSMHYHEMAMSNDPDVKRKQMKLIKNKMLLRAAIGYNQFVYFITHQEVYVLQEGEMRVNALPHAYAKMPLTAFLKCDDAATETKDYSMYFAGVMALLLIIVIILLIFAIIKPQRPPGGGPTIPTATSVVSRRKSKSHKSSKIKKSSKSKIISSSKAKSSKSSKPSSVKWGRPTS